MKTLKTFFIICIAFCISSCSSIKLTETTPFKISGATYHSWVGGQPGVSGVNVIIGIDDDASVTFKNIYFQTRKVGVTLETRNKKKYVLGNINTSTRSEETIIKKETKEKVSKNDFPFELGNNEAVLEYDKAGKTYYYKVSKIKKTETVFYP